MIFSIPFLAAFVLPFLERLLYRPRDVASIRVLVITPTRELAQQIHVVLEKLAQVKTCSFCCCSGMMLSFADDLSLGPFYRVPFLA